jgi:hypothetical protein
MRGKMRTMDRVAFAAQFATGNPIDTVLDVGCRDGALRNYLPPSVRYTGCDLVPGPHVDYVGDIQTMRIDEQFDCVFALDVLEHVDDLHGLFDRLVQLSRRLLVVSLPNCYDIKCRINFAIRGRLGGKYAFPAAPTLDRHRWIMSYDEIRLFYVTQASRHRLAIAMHDMKHGNAGLRSVTGMMGFVSRILGPRLSSSCVVGVFQRADSESRQAMT